MTAPLTAEQYAEIKGLLEIVGDPAEASCGMDRLASAVAWIESALPLVRQAIDRTDEMLTAEAGSPDERPARGWKRAEAELAAARALVAGFPEQP